MMLHCFWQQIFFDVVNFEFDRQRLANLCYASSYLLFHLYIPWWHITIATLVQSLSTMFILLRKIYVYTQIGGWHDRTCSFIENVIGSEKMYNFAYTTTF